MDFVRQGALVAMALVLMQQPEARVAPFRKQLAKFVGDKHEEVMCRCGSSLTGQSRSSVDNFPTHVNAYTCSQQLHASRAWIRAAYGSYCLVLLCGLHERVPAAVTSVLIAR